MTAIVLCILWLLWPLIAFTGGLSYPIFAGLAALVLLPSALHSLRPRIYMAALLAFFVFVGVSATWSPQPVRLVDFDFAHMKFAVRSEMIRVGLLVVADRWDHGAETEGSLDMNLRIELPDAGGWAVQPVSQRFVAPFGLFVAGLGNRQPFADFHRRGLMVNPDELQHHDCTNP